VTFQTQGSKLKLRTYVTKTKHAGTQYEPGNAAARERFDTLGQLRVFCQVLRQQPAVREALEHARRNVGHNVLVKERPGVFRTRDSQFIAEQYMAMHTRVAMLGMANLSKNALLCFAQEIQADEHLLLAF
jgi:hypothetical protein